jgi:hypothetical protein
MTALSPPRARPRLPSWTRPTRRSTLTFAAKRVVLQARRTLADMAAGPRRLTRGPVPASLPVVAQSRTPLWSDEAVSERGHQLGKVQNLRVACRALDGLVLPAGALFSFWRHVGPPIRVRGFSRGRMLQQGCLVPAVGGGLCQLSNALYDAALQAGCRIVERHPHSRIVPGSAAAYGRDATVAWNDVDLRFASPQTLRLTARLERDHLVVRLLGLGESTPAQPRSDEPAALVDARSCDSCQETDCHLHEAAISGRAAPSGRRVFLVDEAWPEFQDYLRETRRAGDRLGAPLNGARFGLRRYAWETDGFDRVADAPLAALTRTLALRAAAAHAAARRRAAEMTGAERIATALARLLTADVTAVIVAQSYLPFLWRAGLLGGREVMVLMTRPPMAALQADLDAAAAKHPERASLADFRAPAWLVDAETQALAEAACIVTPHAQIAHLFGERAHRLAWRTRPGKPAARTGPIRRIAFPGPTIARKGAHAVRAAALALDLEVLSMGAELEGPDFWRGVRRVTGDWTSADAVVQPALVQEQPRALLAALGAGIPVVASEACGLDPQPGLTIVPPDDSAALIAALSG